MDTGPRSGEKRPRTVAPAQNKRNKGKAKISYEDSISTMATVFVAKQERAVSSMESRQTDPHSEDLFEQITEIMSGYDSSDDDDDDVVLLVCVMDSVIRKIRRQSRIPKHVSSFSGHEKMCELITGHEGLLLEHIRMNRDCFHRLVTLFTVQNRLQETHILTVQEQLMMFLTMVAHGDSNRRTSYEWKHSGETVSRYIDTISSHLVQLASRFIVPPDFDDVSTVIAENRRFFPYFQGCVGAIDGTHIPCVVDADVAAAYRNRKGFTSQNVMAVVDFEMKFTYLVAGWEGSCHDARVLNVATRNPAFMFPHAPEGKYYLVDSGYSNKSGYLAPFRNVPYHLRDARRRGGRINGPTELFNYRHASLRNCIERCFGVLKARFPILRFMTNFSLVRQREIAMCCCVLHNFIKLHNRDDPLFQRFGVDGVMPPPDSDDEDNTASSSGTAANPHGYGGNDENLANFMRDHIMIQMYLHYNM
ncbi:hypothetical protein UlMin_027519 [Ulmus minor]